jgi:hypothetical protein
VLPVVLGACPGLDDGLDLGLLARDSELSVLLGALLLLALRVGTPRLALLLGMLAPALLGLALSA